MIRVLHVIDHLGLGGAQSALVDLVTNSDPARVTAEVAALHGRGPFADALESRGIPVHSLSAGKWPPVYVPGLAQLARRGGYDVLHFHLPGANWLGKPLCALVTRAPRVAHEHSSADIRFRGWWTLLPESVAHIFSSHVVAVSNGVAEFLQKYEGVPRRKISVIPNGVDTSVFTAAGAERRLAARAALGLPRDAFVAAGLGRLAPEKNFAAVVAAAKRCPGVEFVVGGAGPEEPALRAASTAQPNFRLVGAVSDRAEFYAAIDVFLLPSWHEALPMTVLEAMAAGVPVVASRLEGVEGALGDFGCLVAPGDDRGIAEQVENLRANPGERARLAEGARARAEQLFSATSTARRIEAVYRQLGAG